MVKKYSTASNCYFLGVKKYSTAWKCYFTTRWFEGLEINPFWYRHNRQWDILRIKWSAIRWSDGHFLPHSFHSKLAIFLQCIIMVLLSWIVALFNFSRAFFCQYSLEKMWWKWYNFQLWEKLLLPLSIAWGKSIFIHKIF